MGETADGRTAKKARARRQSGWDLWDLCDLWDRRAISLVCRCPRRSPIRRVAHTPFRLSSTSPFTTAPGHPIFPALMWLSILIPILLTILVIVCVLLTLVVLMQRPRSEGLGAAFGSGMTENIFGAQTTTVLTKATTYLGGIFFGVTLLLTMLTARQSSERRTGLLENELKNTKPAPTATVAPKTSAVPEATASPKVSVSPISSATPQVSNTPVSSPSAALKEEAKPTATPAAQNSPVATPSATP